MIDKEGHEYISRLEKENRILKRCLLQYAKRKNYEGHWWILKDCGEMARNTLAKINGGKI